MTTRELDLDTLILKSGAHSPDGEFCVMEAVAFVAGEPWSDHPKCASQVIGAFMRYWNDALDGEGRQKLKPYIPRLVDSKGTRAVESKRAWLATDWLIHHQAPAWLDLAGLTEQAATLRALPPILTSVRATKAQPILTAAWNAAGAAAGAAARDAAWAAAWVAAWDAAWAAVGAAAGAAAWAAAWAAAGDAAGDAAGAAAWAAARAAARDAAGAAAGAAAWAAARDAAWAAAGDAARAVAEAAVGAALKPTVVLLEASAFELLDAMLAVK